MSIMFLPKKTFLGCYKKIFFISILIVAGIFLPQFFGSGAGEVKAATLTVCASGCNHTTLASALASSTVGDIVTVGASYNNTLETYPIIFPNTRNLTLDCQNSGAIFRNVLGASTTNYFQVGAVEGAPTVTNIQNCSFEDVGIDLNRMGSNILNNHFTLSAPIGFILGGGGKAGLIGDSMNWIVSSTISGNLIDINYSVDIEGMNTKPVISGIFGSADGPNIISNNSFIYHQTPTGSMGPIVVFSGTNIVSGNYVQMASGTPSSSEWVAIDAYGREDGADTSSSTITHNTIYMGEACGEGGGKGIRWQDGYGTDVNPDIISTINISYNIIKCTNDSDEVAISISKNLITSTVIANIDYNGVYNVGELYDKSGSYANDITVNLGVHNLVSVNPLFQANTLNLSPVSAYLDVNGGEDIGAYSGVHVSTVYVDDDGIINYTTVHATSTDIIGNLKSGDTVYIATGTYGSFIVSSTPVLADNLTIIGAGAGTIIDANDNDSGIALVGINDSSIQNLVVQNAYVENRSYSLNYNYFSYGGIDYNQVVFDAPTSGLFVFYGDSLDGGGNPLEVAIAVPGSGADLSDYVGATVQNWNLGLIDLTDMASDTYSGAYFRADVFPNQATANVFMGNLGLPPIVAWVTSTLTVDGDGNYSYNPSALSGTGITLGAGSATPTITNASYTDKSFSVPQHSYIYSGNNYNYLLDFAFNNNSSTIISSNNQDISAYINDANPSDFDLVLVSTSTYYLTYYLGESFNVNTLEEAQTIFGATANVNYLATSTFVWDEAIQQYIYHAPPADATSTPIATTTYQSNPATPTINVTQNQYAGIKFFSSSGDTVSNVTSTANSYGVWFSGNAANNNVSSTIFSSNLDYDIYSDSTGNNNLKNSTFSASSAFVSSTGSVNAYFKAQVFVTSTDGGGALVGVTVNATSTNASQTASLISGADGYTNHTDYLLAWTMTSDSPTSTTNGGYNPYTFGAVATSTYSATTTVTTLDEPNQVVTLAMQPSGGGSLDAPTGLTATPTSSTQIDLIWNSVGGATNYVLYSAITSEFTATTTVTTTALTSFANTDLIPNTQHFFRILATNGTNSSSYSGITSTYTFASIPSSTSAVANSQTAITVSYSGDASYYYIENTTNSTNSDWVSSTTHQFTGLTCNTSYSFRVKGRNNAGVSTDWSSAVTAVTSACSVNPPSGGGGGVAPSAPAAPITIVSPIIQDTFDLGMEVGVLIGNTHHQVAFVSFDPKTQVVTLQIKSTAIKVPLKVGEEKVLDTDLDKSNDLYLKLNRIDSDKNSVNLTLVSLADLEFAINYNFASTNKQEVVLYLNSPQALQMAISNSSDFSKVSFEPYQRTKKWTLLPGDSLKKVYVKFRTAQGGDKVVSDSITLDSNYPYDGDYAKEKASVIDVGANVAAAVVTTTKITPIFTRVLKIGSTGNDVKTLQTLLKKMGYFKYPNVTTYFGSGTKQSLIQYQKANKLKQTGILDKATMTKLNTEASKTVKTITKPVVTKYIFKSYLSFGSKGEEVKQLQIRLQKLGYLSKDIAPTTYFGTATRAAVIKLQKDHNVKPFSGYVGPLVRGVLNGE